MYKVFVFLYLKSAELLFSFLSNSGCSYFPLWIKVNADLIWFFENRKGILSSLKILFGIPEIDSEDPDLDPVVFMGLSASERSILSYVLVPLCMRRRIKELIQEKDVSVALEKLHIGGIYFGRKGGSQEHDNLSVSSSVLSLTDSLDYAGNDSTVEATYGLYDAESDAQSGQYMHSEILQGEFSETSDLERNHHYAYQPQEMSPKVSDSLKDFGTSMGFVDQNRNLTQKGVPRVDHANLSMGYYTPKKHLPVQVVHPKVSYAEREAAPPKDSSERVPNGMIKVRPQLTYINHNIFRVQCEDVESGSESACEDKTYVDAAAQREAHAAFSKDQIVEERVVASEPPSNAFSLYEPLWNEPNLADPIEQKENSPSKVQVTTQSSESRCFSEMVIPVSAKRKQRTSSSQPSNTVHAVRPSDGYTTNNARHAFNVVESTPDTTQVDTHKPSWEMRYAEHSIDNSVRPIHGYVVPSGSELGLVQTRETLQHEQQPTWEEIPGSEDSARISKDNSLRKWYEEVNGDGYSSRQMQPEPEPEMTVHQGPINHKPPDEDQLYRIMQPEPEQGFVNRNDYFNAGREWQHSDFSPHAMSSEINSFQNSKGQLVKVTTKVVDYQPQQASVFSPDDSAHSLDESFNFSSSFLCPAPLTLPSVTRPLEAQDGSIFPSASLSSCQEIPDAGHGNPRVCAQYQDNIGVMEGRPRQSIIFMKSECEPHSDYEDSVFTDTGGRTERDGPSFAPPPYHPPPDYRIAVRNKQPMMSVDGSTTSTG